MSALTARILLVGSASDEAADLPRILAKVGCQLAGRVHTGREALQVLDREPFDVALVNLWLKGPLDGMATAEELRKRRIPVIYITLRHEAELCQSSRWGNPCGYLIGPIDIDSLYIAISAALYQKQLLQDAFVAQSLLRTILKQVHDGIIITDMSGQVQSMSTTAEKITGWTSSEAIGKPAEQICPVKEMNGGALQHPLRRALENNSVQRRGRFALADRNGHEIPVEGYAASLCDATERISGAVIIFWDIAERVRLEHSQSGERARQAGNVVPATESSSTTNTELLALISRAITAQEDERRRVARELHDDLGQRIALLQFEAERMCRFAKVPEVRKGLRRLIEAAERFSADLRTLSHRLHPSLLEELGLGAALRSLAADYRRQGVEVTLWVSETSGRASLDVRTSLYRITQEALRNAWKHAPGAAVRIQLVEKDEQLQLTIDDTGPGFDVTLTRATGGLGLLSMQERARLVGGTLLLNSNTDSGTTLVVSVPIRITP